jgi:preprotein translocase subunit SecG
MDILLTLVMVVHVATALAIIGLVLLQHGKGADVGAAFGSGSSGSLFGATGSANFLSRTTAALAVVFFLSSLGLAYLANAKPRGGASVMDQAPAAPSAPASAVPKPAAGDAPGSRADEVPK